MVYYILIIFIVITSLLNINESRQPIPKGNDYATTTRPEYLNVDFMHLGGDTVYSVVDEGVGGATTEVNYGPKLHVARLLLGHYVRNVDVLHCG